MKKHFFLRLLQSQEVTLVNPSFGTMAALSSTSTPELPGYVSLTHQEGEEMQWEAQIKDFIYNSGGRLVLQPRYEIRGIAYMGTLDPVWYPKKNDWLRLIPSPFVQHTQDYEVFVSKLTDRGFSAEYERKGNAVHASMWYEEKGVYRWNPESVDKVLSTKKKKFFLESNCPLQIVPVENYRIQHKPKFLQGYGEWEGKWNIKDNFVYDVQEGESIPKDTYFSRRARHLPPVGKEWAPFVSVGQYIVTVSCIHPFEDSRFSFNTFEDKGICVVSIDGSVPEFVKRVQFGDLDVSPDLVDYRYVLESGVVFPKESRSESAIAYRWDGTNVLPSPFSRLEVVTLPLYTYNTMRYIDVTSIKQKVVQLDRLPITWCIASSKENLMKMIPELSAYISKRWIGRKEWSHLPIEQQDGGLGSGSVLASQIREYLRYRSQIVFTPVTTYEISNALNAPVRTVEMYCYRIPEIMMWKQAILGFIEWVHLSDLFVHLPDNSMSYKKAIERLRMGEILISPLDFGGFKTFLAINDFRAKVRNKLGKYELSIL